MRTRPIVLVVDDDEGIRAAMAMRLGNVGFDVQTAANGAEAIASIRTEHPDAALIDVQMPDMDGFAICEHIRQDETCKDIPVFMLTGSDDSVVRKFLGTLTATVGGNHCITKPCDGKSIADQLWTAVHAASG